MIHSLLLYKHCPATVFLPYNWLAVTALWWHPCIMCQLIGPYQSYSTKGVNIYVYGWLPLKDWVKCRKATMTYKAINGKAPDSIRAMFRYVSDVHKQTTRQTCNKDHYIPSNARLNVFRNTKRYAGVYIWYNLPAKVKHVSSVEMLKRSYPNMYFS